MMVFPLVFQTKQAPLRKVYKSQILPLRQSYWPFLINVLFPKVKGYVCIPSC